MTVGELKKLIEREKLPDDTELLIRRTVQDVGCYENIACAGSLDFNSRKKEDENEKDNHFKSLIFFPLEEYMGSIELRTHYLGKTGFHVTPKVIGDIFDHEKRMFHKDM